MKFFPAGTIRPSYLLVSVLNSLTTYLIYLGLLLFLPPKLSYLISYLGGIVFSYFGNKRYVFQRRNGGVGLFFLYGFNTVSLLILSFLVYSVFITLMPLWIAPWGVVALLYPLSYAANHLLFTRFNKELS